MGCGCGRKSNGQNPQRRTTNPLPVVTSNNIEYNSYVANQAAECKRKVCKVCPYVTRNSKGLFDENARCRKANRSISSILRDPTFKCPIQKF